MVGGEREDDLPLGLDHPRTARDRGAVEGEDLAGRRGHLADADGDVEGADAPPPGAQAAGLERRAGRDLTGEPLLAHGTILESGNSRMSVAPLSFSAGIKMLISDFATTVSSA